MAADVESQKSPVYCGRVVTAFTACAIVWAILGMAAGVYVAAELA